MKRKSYFVIVATCVATWASTQAQGPSHREEEQESRFSQILTAGKMMTGALLVGTLEVVSQYPLQVIFGIALPLVLSWLPEGEACGRDPYKFLEKKPTPKPATQVRQENREDFEVWSASFKRALLKKAG